MGAGHATHIGGPDPRPCLTPLTKPFGRDKEIGPAPGGRRGHPASVAAGRLPMNVSLDPFDQVGDKALHGRPHHAR